MLDDPLLITAVLGISVALSEWLARRTWLRHLGSALLVIVLTAVVANVGLIPTYSAEVHLYAAVFEHVAPLAIFLLLLQVHLRGLLQAGAAMVSLFLLGAAGTMAGVFAGMWIVGGSAGFGDLHHALGGMFVGTYTGGSINFNAIALEYGVVEDGLLYAGAAAVDSAMTTLWMAATVVIPRMLWRLRPRGAPAPREHDADTLPGAEDIHDEETVHAMDLALLLALGAGSVWFSSLATGWIESAFGVGIPMILILTTVALVLAQLPIVQQLRGARLCGWFAVLLFLAVIGALCDLSALARIGSLGTRLMLFVTVVVVVHGLIVFAPALFLRADPDMAAVASQANIGGSTSALALARSLDRNDLVLPAILIGALGNALGTYLGFLTAAWLR